MKKCWKCKTYKKLVEFYYCVRNADGLTDVCKKCKKELNKTYRIKNGAKIRSYQKQWREDNQEKCSNYSKQYSKINSQKVTTRATKWNKEHPEKRKANNRLYNQSKKGKQTKVKWVESNRIKINQQQSRRDRQKRKTDPKFKLRQNMSNMTRRIIKEKKNYQHWEDLVGYTIEELRNHLESQFQEGMTWDNYGKWHIEHKIPVSVFNFDSPEQIDFKRCWALENLQPMWAKENIAKHAKLSKHFQPMLKLNIG